MTHWYHLTRKSSNKKTGPIAVSTTSKDSCPSTCPLRGNGCYAESGPLRLHWDAVSDGPYRDKPRGTDLELFLGELSALPEGSCFRHNQAGDLPHFNGSINRHVVWRMAHVCGERKLHAWTYTHHNLNDRDNRVTVFNANKLGLTINVSAHSEQHAAHYHKQGIPAVCIVPKGETRNHWEYDGVKFLVCPAQTSDKTCADCKLCAIKDRACVIAFKAHGTQVKKVEATIL